MPDMCLRSVDEDLTSNSDLSCLFTDAYDQYFVRLDKFERYRDLLKMQNVLKKREKTFIYELEGHLKEEAQESDMANQERLNEIQILNINQLEESAFLEGFLSDKQHLTERIDREEEKIYRRVENIRVKPVHEFPVHVFWRLSALVQRHCMERFDWVDTIIGRDEDFNCFRVKFTPDMLVFELKSLSDDLMEKFGKSVMGLVEELFSYYPGIYQVATVETVV